MQWAEGEGLRNKVAAPRAASLPLWPFTSGSGALDVRGGSQSSKSEPDPTGACGGRQLVGSYVGQCWDLGFGLGLGTDTVSRWHLPTLSADGDPEQPRLPATVSWGSFKNPDSLAPQQA